MNDILPRKAIALNEIRKRSLNSRKRDWWGLKLLVYFKVWKGCLLSKHEVSLTVKYSKGNSLIFIIAS